MTRARSAEGPTISLFPFLAVLLCTNVLLAAGLAFAFARGRRGRPVPQDDANTPPGR